MPKELKQSDLNNLMLTWQAALTMAHGQVSDFKEAYIEDKDKMTPEQIAEWMGSRILSYHDISQTELKGLLLKYLDILISKGNQRFKELH